MFQILHQVQSNMKKSSDSSHTTSVCGNDPVRMSGAVAIALLHTVLWSEGRLGIQSSSTHPLQTQAVDLLPLLSSMLLHTNCILSIQHSRVAAMAEKVHGAATSVLFTSIASVRTQQEVAAACDAADLQQHVTLLHCLPVSHCDTAYLRSRCRLRPWSCYHCSQ